jgi:hypothetical protein
MIGEEETKGWMGMGNELPVSQIIIIMCVGHQTRTHTRTLTRNEFDYPEQHTNRRKGTGVQNNSIIEI